jgi:hypothetical protein
MRISNPGSFVSMQQDIAPTMIARKKKWKGEMCTDKKEKKIFLKYKEIQMGATGLQASLHVKGKFHEYEGGDI